MHPLLARLDQWLAVNRPVYYAGLMPGAPEADVDELARDVGGELPVLLRELFTWHNGQDRNDGCLESLWFLMSTEDTAAAIEDMLWVKETEGFEDLWWGAGWVPFLANIYGDYMCVDLQGAFDGTPGQLIEFRSKDEFRNIRYPSLEAWLETFVIALETGMFEEAGQDYRPGCWDPVDSEAYEALIAGRYPGYPIETCIPDSPDDPRGESFSDFVDKHYKEELVHAVDLDTLHAALRGTGVGDSVVDRAFDRLREVRTHGTNTEEE
ncbi:SMI1/KNR4 family protein [Nocardia cyriacigeorgica]|uniref:SMI1/KNR4 family protein n=1 Tax=Nocardia cyriacigeorgica TaxID=135487 RepID=A0A6P1D5J2_9NOCA|nr:SMI1/KNR4 family protein [Nocardia cyriacigeorgica]NEW41979.1 SMI1/KNR4 family protein [Nocardia cyriacigeorgica]NEW44761.1 SMI1/KNR4 family protein [Nocardia cyriacigeorgica]NEW50493.1 SMI1/KNR4 family protein [Nocardia cyriacigeorgica]NEW59332.1 SMI1/KNR4 family protein [Nocardia cyriacigeorgica]